MLWISSSNFICMNCTPAFVVERVCFNSYSEVKPILFLSNLEFKSRGWFKIMNREFYVLVSYLKTFFLFINNHLLFKTSSLKFFINDIVVLLKILFFHYINVSLFNLNAKEEENCKYEWLNSQTNSHSIQPTTQKIHQLDYLGDPSSLFRNWLVNMRNN